MAIEMVGFRSTFRLLVLMIFVTWVKGKSEILLSCSALGGDCVSKKSNTCSIQVKSSGCDRHEICCKLQRNQGGSSSGECAMTNACSDVNGTCTVNSCRIYEEEVPNGCNGDGGCKCCAPHFQCGCGMTKACFEANGRCKDESCNADEKEVADGCTGDAGCKCCVQVCEMTKACSDVNGTCTEKSCRSYEEEVPNGCNGDGCKCCAPQFQCGCGMTEACFEANGRCEDESCNADEKEVADGCTGDAGCKCCAPDPQGCTITRQCQTIGGNCKEVCASDEDSINICNGNCGCCVPNGGPNP